MLDLRKSKADVHVHSKYSDRPSEWFLRRIGAPECFVEPLEVYRRARQRGWISSRFPTTTASAARWRSPIFPGAFISNEATSYFPEDGCKIHVLTLGISEEQFRMIQELRANIYELHHYIVAEDIIASVSHPLYRVNGRLTIDHLEKLILMFTRFEAINGARGQRQAEITEAVLRGLGEEMVAKMADRHGIAPTGWEPWKKTFTGGSDDHGAVFIGPATPPLPTPATRPSSSPICAAAITRPPRFLRRLRHDGAQPVPHRLRLLQGPLPQRRQQRQAEHRRRVVPASCWKATARRPSRRAWAGESSAWPRISSSLGT